MVVSKEYLEAWSASAPAPRTSTSRTSLWRASINLTHLNLVNLDLARLDLIHIDLRPAHQVSGTGTGRGVREDEVHQVEVRHVEAGEAGHLYSPFWERGCWCAYCTSSGPVSGSLVQSVVNVVRLKPAQSAGR